MNGLLTRFQVYIGSTTNPGTWYINQGAPWQSDTRQYSYSGSLNNGWFSLNTAASNIWLNAGDHFVIGAQGN